jgi:hypothetical protein
VLIPKFKNKAYLSAKALLHVVIQRECMGDEFDEDAFKSISKNHKIIGYKEQPNLDQYQDLESALHMIDRTFKGSNDLELIPLQNFSLSDPHRAWMGRILLYPVWKSIRRNNSLPEDIKEFVLHSLQVQRPPPASIVTGCLLMIGAVLNVELHIEEQATDKRLVDL